jgi:hypothetical protein
MSLGVPWRIHILYRVGTMLDLLRLHRPGTGLRNKGKVGAGSKPVSDQVWVEVLEDRTLPSVTVGVSVDGMNTTNNSCNCQPPDTIAAAGPNHVVHMVNTAIEIFNKDGTVAVAPESLLTFFSNHINANQSDPWVVYDEISGHFFAGILDFSSGNAANDIDWAIGTDSASGVTWALQTPIPSAEGSEFADYPREGFNADAYFISVNMFNGNTFSHVQTITINASTNTVSSRHDDTTGLFTLTPAVMHGAVTGGPEYFVEAPGGSTLDVTTETNVLSSSPTFTNASVSVPSYRSGGSAPQGVAGFDDRIFNVAYRTVNGVSHLVAADQVASTSHRNAAPVARWYDINAGTKKLIQDGNAPAGVSGASTFMPSVDINTAGSIGMTFDESASSEFWSMYVTERTASDPAGTMEAAVKVANGVAKTTDSRVGDFSSTSVDPSDGLTFWSANEFQGSDFWDTHIASFSIAGAVHSHHVTAVSQVTAAATGTGGLTQVAIAATGLSRATAAAASSGGSAAAAVVTPPQSGVTSIDRLFAAMAVSDVRLALFTPAAGKGAASGALLQPPFFTL